MKDNIKYVIFCNLFVIHSCVDYCNSFETSDYILYIANFGNQSKATTLSSLNSKYIHTNLHTQIEEIGYFTFSNNSDVVSPNETLPNSIFIFDVTCDKQDTIREYFAMGRYAVDCFSLCQTYAKIPKHLTHDNANLLILQTGW